jgi:hypothetical protein
MKKKLFSTLVIIIFSILFFHSDAHAEDITSEVTTSTDATATSTASEQTIVPTATLHIRYQDRFVFEGILPLSTSTIFTYHDSGSSNTQTTSTPISSVLALLVAATNTTTTLQMNNAF